MRIDSNRGLPLRSLLVALALVATACQLVGGATGVKSTSSADKQLKNQFNSDELHSLTKHEATRQSPATLSSALSEKTASQKQQSSANQSQETLATSGSSSAAAQQVAEKKQGDTAAQDIFGSDEYVQIKPEEITVNENGKEIVVGQIDSQLAEPQQQPANGASAEHKAADDELNAHLAQDSISQQESASYNSYSPLVATRPQPAAASRAAYQAPRAASYKAAPRPLPPSAGAYPPPPESAPRVNRSPSRLPPSYITLKGKLTGINSIISQYPHPAPGYPHQGPRHLPRGAAAGYAAFRDFVRAHASKYKNVAAQQVAQAAPAGYAPALPAEPAGYERPKQATSYGPSKQAPPAYGAPGGQATRSPLKTKVTVAQAYIPHLSSPSASGYGASQAQTPYTNPVLAKLYGGHAPQGIGKPEYSKDYGMVIHYPQATVYTEPMTVDQLHKLTGAGISQVLEQLQYNFAHGQRDESNTLRGNNKHHIGHGITIHAKEYYAPGKSGQYVPTTAAVISTSPQQSYGANKPAAAYEEPQAPAGYEAPSAPVEYQQTGSYNKLNAELGLGYERVKQVANSGNQKYNNKRSNYTAANNEYQQPPAAPQQYAAPSYEQSNGNRYGNGEPLSAITSFIGSELDALYKANAALTKHLEPEIYAGIQAHKSSNKANAPLRYTELQQPRPYQPQASGYSAAAPAPYNQQPAGASYKQGGYRNQRQQRGRANHPRQPSSGGNRHYRPPQRQPAAYNRPPPPPQQGYGGYRTQAGSYQQQAAAYQAAEQSLDQQMMQLLQDFRAGDEQYNSKSQPAHSINQGYPNKVMQKYNQQRPQQPAPAGYGGQQNQQLSAYAHHDGLEIPQGPNDQIGEIADLIEALKGSLDLSKQEQPASDGYAAAPKPKQLEEVRYLASALGQAPTYAIQVPVASGESSAAYEPAAKKEADAGYQEATSRPYSKPASGTAYQAPEASYGPNQNYGGQQAQYGAQQQLAPAAYQQPAAGYQQPATSYQQPATSYQQPATSYQQPATSYQQPATSYEQPAATYQQQPASGYQQPAAGYQQAQPDYQQQAGQEYQSAAPAGDYAPQQQPQAASYAQPPAASQPAEQAPASGYEHSQVINHLVPVTTSSGSSSQSAQSSYSQASSQQQPAVSQIAIAAPTESQYQQAQSLSSFVDSLATEYQELLRQPAPGLLDAHNGAAAQLALQPASQSSESSAYNSNATAPAAYETVGAAASQQVASSTSSQAASQQSSAKSQSTSASSGAQQQQQYKKAA